jgi:hypothetical protein|tara:strand:- start:7576 stop:8433 length:858 start_codon:yes stop_codon:yes gene_type:complete
MSRTEDFVSDLTFPATLGSNKLSAKNSIALFQAQLKKEQEFSYNIYLPGPTALSVNDQANYSTTDFGMTGAQNKFGEDSVGQALEAAGLRIGKGAGGIIGMEASEVEKRAGLIINPNTNTTFGGNGVRSFSFQYKLIADSEEESQAIKQIIRRFKGLSYAALNNTSNVAEPAGLILTYPPIWKIKFLTTSTGGGFSENKFMPKISTCYLTSVETNYNPNSNIFFKGGAPNEIDLSITYQETRALNRNDIDELENTIDQEGDFNPPQVPQQTLPPSIRAFNTLFKR